MYRSFHEFVIIKPVTSRPANSERYIVCRGKRERRPAVVDYMLEVNRELNSNRDVVELVSASEMPKHFTEYMRASSIAIGEAQVEALKELIKYMEDKNLAPLDQIGTR